MQQSTHKCLKDIFEGGDLLGILVARRVVLALALVTAIPYLIIAAAYQDQAPDY